MKRFNKKKFIIFFLFFILLLFVVYIFIKKHEANRPLKVAFLDVGQGDAIYIEAPNKKQILIDGGRDQKVLSELSRIMPFSDRSIDIVMSTHPDADHIGGLEHVLDRYTTEIFFDTGARSGTKTYQSLVDTIKDKEISHVVARRGTDIVLDQKNNIVLHIIFPDHSIFDSDTNDSSLTTMLSFEDHKILLTGDLSSEKELYLLDIDGEKLNSDILKIGHHGSRTSSAPEFIEIVSPEMAIISAGENNSYGHPHKEVTDLLNSMGIKYMETSKEGTIICKLKKTEFKCK